MTKKTLVVFLFFLACCTSGPAPALIVVPTSTSTITPTPIRTPVPTHVFREADSATIKAFETSETCPNICWLGIHAGTTSTGQAVALLKNSKDIRQLEIFNDHILAQWFPTDTKENSTSAAVSIEFSSGVVESLELKADNYSIAEHNLNILVGDFFSLIGEPDQLKLDKYCYSDFKEKSDCVRYTLYYPIYELALDIDSAGDKNGPFSNDSIGRITVNMLLEGSEYLQPWLGYGHLEDYSKKPMPTPTALPAQ